MKLALGLASSALVVGCGEPKSPTLCVSTSGVDVAALMACPQTTSQPFSVRTGEAVYVVQRLPAGVDPGDQTVSIALSTACGATSQNVSYANGVAFTVLAAPPGAECSATVTATIENSTIRLVSTVDAVACATAPACPADAGVPFDDGGAATDAVPPEAASDGAAGLDAAEGG
jgi:hypothetical protein